MTGRRVALAPGDWKRPAAAAATGRLAPLRELGQEVAELYGWTGPLPGPSVDPRLVTTYSPSAMRRQEAEALEWLEATGKDSLAVAPPAGGADHLGLSPDRNSDAAPKPKARTGLKGLTPEGARSIRQATSALEETRQLVAFWTITLPDEAMAEVQRQDCWASFQDAIRRYLVRALVAAGLPPLACGVAELHPKRTAATGRPCPHLHVAFQGKRNRWEAWRLDRWRLDGIIGRAFYSSTGTRMPTIAAGNVQGVRRSLTRYLGRYLTKGSAPMTVCGAQIHGLPRQWWFWSQALRRLVIRHTVPLPYRFVRWCHAHRRGLETMGDIRHGSVDGLPPGAPACFWIRWLTPLSMSAAVQRWVAAGMPDPP